MSQRPPPIQNQPPMRPPVQGMRPPMPTTTNPHANNVQAPPPNVTSQPPASHRPPPVATTNPFAGPRPPAPTTGPSSFAGPKPPAPTTSTAYNPSAMRPNAPNASSTSSGPYAPKAVPMYRPTDMSSATSQQETDNTQPPIERPDIIRKTHTASRRMYPEQMQRVGHAVKSNASATSSQSTGPLYTPAFANQGDVSAVQDFESGVTESGPKSADAPSSTGDTSSYYQPAQKTLRNQNAEVTVEQLFPHLPKEGVVSPTFFRATTRACPSSQQIASRWHLPFAAVVQPLAKPPDGLEIPIVEQPNPDMLIRCRQPCRAYINPYVTFIEHGHRWVCNLCGRINDVPPNYYAPVDSNGVRSDLGSRPELTHASVEMIAPKDYMLRAPQPPSYLFCIDVSHQAVASGMLSVACSAIKESLDVLPGDDRTLVGVVTYDATIHFYNLRPNLSQPQMMVVSDLSDVFLPMPNDLMVNLQQSRAQVETLLDKLPKMFSTTTVDSCAGSALEAAFNVLKPIGGKIVCMAANLPSVGKARLKHREDRRLLGTDKEKMLLTPVDDFYKQLAVESARSQIAIDLFLFSDSYTDVATLSCLPRFSCGHLYHYPAFRSAVQGDKLRTDILDLLTREIGFETVLRVRNSKSVRVENFYGHHFRRSQDLLVLPNVDSAQAFGLEFKLEDSLVAGNVFYSQCAVLYSTSSGERHIRVHTLALPLTNNLSDMYRLADVDAIMCYSAKVAVERALMEGTAGSREYLVKQCVESLIVYRNQVSSQARNSSQLVLPEALQLLPLYILAAIKHRAFRAGSSVTSDERSYTFRKLTVMGVSDAVQFLYPRLHQLYPLLVDSDAQQPVQLPANLNLSYDKLQSGGCYALTDGTQMFIWVGKDISVQFLHDVFGATAFDDKVVTQSPFVVRRGSALSERTHQLIAEINRNSHECPLVTVVKQGDAMESRMIAYLIEDKSLAMMSYAEFLSYLHKRLHQ